MWHMNISHIIGALIQTMAKEYTFHLKLVIIGFLNLIGIRSYSKLIGIRSFIILRFCSLYLEFGDNERSSLIYLKLQPCSGTQLPNITLWMENIVHYIVMCAMIQFPRICLGKELGLNPCLLVLITYLHPWIRNRERLMYIEYIAYSKQSP